LLIRKHISMQMRIPWIQTIGAFLLRVRGITTQVSGGIGMSYQ
jgi:hypothetical protein